VEPALVPGTEPDGKPPGHHADSGARRIVTTLFKREENPAGSSNNLRGDMLRVLGVLKVATVEQIQQIAA
jgi:hypothetical protein